MSGKPKEFKGQLLRLREARRLADRDAQLLANRIALLEAEEAKAWKKIKQTKERAENILTLRQEHQQERNEIRRQVRLQKQGGSRKKANSSYVEREVNGALHEKKKKVQSNRARKLAHDMKAEQARLARDRRQQANEILSRNKERRDKIYKSKQDSRLKREQAKKKKLAKNQEVYLQRVELETRARRTVESRVRGCCGSLCVFACTLLCARVGSTYSPFPFVLVCFSIPAPVGVGGCACVCRLRRWRKWRLSRWN